jgi:hypothetical protein
LRRAVRNSRAELAQKQQQATRKTPHTSATVANGKIAFVHLNQISFEQRRKA